MVRAHWGRPAILAAVLLHFASPAWSGLDLSWHDCNLGPGAASDLIPDCTQSQTYRLFGSFQVPTTFHGFNYMVASLDVRSADGELPAFWRFGMGSCNDTGLVLSNDIPAGTCPAPDHASPWEPHPSSIAYAVDPADPGHALITIDLPRYVRHGFTLNAGTNYFAFVLTLSTSAAKEAGGACGGCAAPLVFVWNSARLSSFTATLTVTNSGVVSQCATVNGAGFSACAATPVRNRTWGAIKALYR